MAVVVVPRTERVYLGAASIVVFSSLPTFPVNAPPAHSRGARGVMPRLAGHMGKARCWRERERYWYMTLGGGGVVLLSLCCSGDGVLLLSGYIGLGYIGLDCGGLWRVRSPSPARPFSLVRAWQIALEPGRRLVSRE